MSKKKTKKDTSPMSSDPLILASNLPHFGIAQLADSTGVPAREIRLALGPAIDEGTLLRVGADEWEWAFWVDDTDLEDVEPDHTDDD